MKKWSQIDIVRERQTQSLDWNGSQSTSRICAKYKRLDVPPALGLRKDRKQDRGKGRDDRNGDQKSD